MSKAQKDFGGLGSTKEPSENDCFIKLGEDIACTEIAAQNLEIIMDPVMKKRILEDVLGGSEGDNNNLIELMVEAAAANGSFVAGRKKIDKIATLMGSEADEFVERSKICFNTVQIIPREAKAYFEATKVIPDRDGEELGSDIDLIDLGRARAHAEAAAQKLVPDLKDETISQLDSVFSESNKNVPEYDFTDFVENNRGAGYSDDEIRPKIISHILSNTTSASPIIARNTITAIGNTMGEQGKDFAGKSRDYLGVLSRNPEYRENVNQHKGLTDNDANFTKIACPEGNDCH